MSAQRKRKSRKCPTITPGIADHYARADERIVEFWFPPVGDHPAVGGLICLMRKADGSPYVEVYTVDAGVMVTAPARLP